MVYPISSTICSTFVSRAIVNRYERRSIVDVIANHFVFFAVKDRCEINSGRIFLLSQVIDKFYAPDIMTARPAMTRRSRASDTRYACVASDSDEAMLTYLSALCTDAPPQTMALRHAGGRERTGDHVKRADGEKTRGMFFLSSRSSTSRLQDNLHRLHCRDLYRVADKYHGLGQARDCLSANSEYACSCIKFWERGDEI